MIPSQIEYEIREPTGLRLGTYDLFMIRQKIYTGELAPRCEYLDERGSWAPLSAHPKLSDVVRLLERGDGPVQSAGPRTAPRIAGWSSTGSHEPVKAAPAEAMRATPAPPAAAPAPRPERPTPDKKPGFFGRLFGKK